MNKKILIVTLWDNTNIGNRLQNYALQQLIRKMDCDVDTSVVDIYPIPLKKRIKKKVKLLLGMIGVMKYQPLVYLEKRRQYISRNFTQKYIPDTLYVGKFSNAAMVDYSKYDYVIVGSDQVWHNWYKSNSELEYYYLKYVPKPKRISFAASFGFDHIPECDYELHRKGLQGLSAISCREEKGVELVKEVSGRDAILLVDPTLCLTSDEWKKLEQKPACDIPKTGNYILTYFLGPFPNDLKITFNNTNEDIVDVMKFGSKNNIFIGPCEFLWLIRNAEIVYTDSFHATVFSILFKKKFCCYRRSGLSMWSRIITLASKTGLLDNLNMEKGEFKVTDLSLYNNVDKALKHERIMAISFLNNSMSEDKHNDIGID